MIEVQEDAYQEDIKGLEPSQLNAQIDTLILEFIAIVGESDETIADQKSEDKPSDEMALLEDYGNPHVVMNAEVKIVDKLYITGNSNLLEGSIIQLKSYHLTDENPYLKGEMIVDENGEFSLEMDIGEDSLTGDSLKLELAYQPEKSDDEAVKEIYGTEGEKIEGPLKQKYTDIKRTRYGAITHTLVEFTEGEHKQFNVRDWDKPDDYGDLSIWLEPEDVEVHDNFYNITMKSNLNELTKIQVVIEVPGYDVAGVRGGTFVGPDGSFQFQIQRPSKEIEDKNDIIIVVEATSDSSIETEEIYGEYGENFAGDLVKDTKRGQKIQYKFNIQDVKQIVN